MHTFKAVFVTVNANHETINRTYTANAVIQSEVSPTLLKSNYNVDHLIIEALKKASKDLYVQLNNWAILKTFVIYRTVAFSSLLLTLV